MQIITRWILSILTAWICVIAGILWKWDLKIINIIALPASDSLLFLGKSLALAWFPGLIIVWGWGKLSKHDTLPTGKPLLVLVISSLTISTLAGVIPLYQDHRRIYWFEKYESLIHQLETQSPVLRKEGRIEEIVTLLEDALEAHEHYIAIEDTMEYDFAHGFSYLFCTLYPASDDIPNQLGYGVSAFLYDYWHYSSSGVEHQHQDQLEKYLTRSNHPVLRAIGYWVTGDYQNFNREAMEGAKAGDRRMDAFALFVACVLHPDKSTALSIVTPILERGVGLGKQHGRPYIISSEQIRSYLEGNSPPLNYLHPKYHLLSPKPTN